MGLRGGAGAGGAKACCVMRAPFGVSDVVWAWTGAPGTGASDAWVAYSGTLMFAAGLGDGTAAPGASWLTALRRPVGPTPEGAWDSLLWEPADGSGVGEPVEPPRPPTWIVIFLGWPEGVDSDPGTLSLIFDCGGSGTAALASSNCCLNSS